MNVYHKNIGLAVVKSDKVVFRIETEDRKKMLHNEK